MQLGRREDVEKQVLLACDNLSGVLAVPCPAVVRPLRGQPLALTVLQAPGPRHPAGLREIIDGRVLLVGEPVAKLLLTGR